ncbi:DUF3347 domain-containing protein [Sphingobacterium faecale]|uniref:DUF3347 domain-containing protein n=1 Tax=Sphingobacterium faecale TaxID=2803775 RepID=A0ABS1R600_9SPHI|nr:DUF3347 domain-containing protein [Sphingobacterium faecale]MBL1410123.1 DUF3347 domain-containing protein [Sphingobacterium faecale]
MKTIIFWISICSILTTTNNIYAQVKNAKTETFHVNGNCDMCKATIEKAGNKKKEAQVTWDASSQSASIVYDAEKTNSDAILKRIALAGYDNEKYLAPDETYTQLHGCCKYERTLKGKEIVAVSSHQTHEKEHQHHSKDEKKVESHTFQTVMVTYFSLKDALVSSDSKVATSQAKSLLQAIESLKMETLSTNAHQIWMDQVKEITALTNNIVNSSNIADQRKHFAALSTKLYPMVKASPLASPVYYQNCPMFENGKGANWLSLNEEIKNPFYGSKMMTCGSVKEKIN